MLKLCSAMLKKGSTVIAIAVPVLPSKYTEHFQDAVLTKQSGEPLVENDNHGF